MERSSRLAQVAAGRKNRCLWDPIGQEKSGTGFVVLRLLWRIALLGLLFAVATVAGLICGRLTSLWGLPDAPEPFDTTSFRHPDVPADRDAFAVFPLALKQFQPFSRADWPGPLQTVVSRDWPRADRDVQSWLLRNRQTLDFWRQSADRPETTLRRPNEHDLLEGAAPFAIFLLAQLEASRLETDGDLDGAWAWHRACLRMIRHTQDYDPLRRAADTQQAWFPVVLKGVRRWCENSRLGIPLLRRALDDAQALDVPPTRGSAALALEYIAIARTLDDPPRELAEQAWDDLRSDGDDLLWYRHIPLFHESRWFIRNEPERSRRVARLVFTNWIANCEMPSALWPNPATWAASGNRNVPLMLLTSSGGTGVPGPVGGLTAAELSNWHDSTLLFRRHYSNETCHKLASYQAYVIKRRADQVSLVLTLAEELYAKEHGGQYPGSPSDLVGRYLKALPDDSPSSVGNSAGQTATP